MQNVKKIITYSQSNSAYTNIQNVIQFQLILKVSAIFRILKKFQTYSKTQVPLFMFELQRH